MKPVVSTDEVLTADEVWLAPGDDDRLERRRRQAEKRHRFMLGLAVFIIAMAFALEVRPDQRVQFRFAPGLPLPEMCGSRLFFGVECPGCGLTRGFILMSRGRWDEAFHLNRIAWIFGISVLAQIPYRLAALYEMRRGRFIDRQWAFWYGWLIVAALILNWIARQLGY